jgi:hypothetical protein
MAGVIDAFFFTPGNRCLIEVLTQNWNKQPDKSVHRMQTSAHNGNAPSSVAEVSVLPDEHDHYHADFGELIVDLDVIWMGPPGGFIASGSATLEPAYAAMFRIDGDAGGKASGDVSFQLRGGMGTISYTFHIVLELGASVLRLKVAKTS